MTRLNFLQLESQLQQDELQKRQHSEHAFVQNIETNSHQQQINNFDIAPNEGIDLQK